MNKLNRPRADIKLLSKHGVKAPSFFKTEDDSGQGEGSC